MADAEDTGSDKKGSASVDADALKARLGLTRRSRQVSRPQTEDRRATQPSEEDVAEARRRAEDALAEEGTPIEAFDPLGQEHTPLPQALPTEDSLLDVQAGKGKLGLVPVVIALLTVALVGLLLGQVLGRSLSHRDQLESYLGVVKDKLAYIEGAKTASGKSVLEEIAAMKEALDAAVDDINTVESQKDPDPLVLENLFSTLVPKLARFREDKVLIDVRGLRNDLVVMYAEDPLLDALRFANDSKLLYDTVGAIAGEATTLLRMEQPAGSPIRALLNQRVEREVEGVGKIPAGKGVWVKDTGRPAEVKLVDPTNPGLERTEWQMMVLTEESKSDEDAVQVPTDQILQVDLSGVYAEQAHAVKLLRVDRFAQLTRQAHRVASSLAWAPLQQKLQDWAAKAD